MSLNFYRLVSKEAHTFKYEFGHVVATSQNISYLKSILKSAEEKFKFAYTQNQLTEAEYKDIVNDFCKHIKGFNLPEINSQLHIFELEDTFTGDWVVNVP